MQVLHSRCIDRGRDLNPLIIETRHVHDVASGRCFHRSLAPVRIQVCSDRCSVCAHNGDVCGCGRCAAVGAAGSGAGRKVHIGDAERATRRRPARLSICAIGQLDLTYAAQGSRRCTSRKSAQRNVHAIGTARDGGNGIGGLTSRCNERNAQSRHAAGRKVQVQVLHSGCIDRGRDLNPLIIETCHVHDVASSRCFHRCLAPVRIQVCSDRCSVCANDGDVCSGRRHGIGVLRLRRVAVAADIGHLVDRQRDDHAGRTRRWGDDQGIGVASDRGDRACCRSAGDSDLARIKRRAYALVKGKGEHHRTPGSRRGSDGCRGHGATGSATTTATQAEDGSQHKGQQYRYFLVQFHIKVSGSVEGSEGMRSQAFSKKRLGSLKFESAFMQV